MPPVTKAKKSRPRPVYFETTIPVIRPCSRCAVWLAAGVAEGVKAEAEIVVLDPGQVVWAVLAKIDLYVLRRTGLIYMDRSRLEGRHLGRLYPQHRCDVVWPRPPMPGLSNLVRDDIPPY